MQSINRICLTHAYYVKCRAAVSHPRRQSSLQEQICSMKYCWPFGKQRISFSHNLNSDENTQGLHDLDCILGWAHICYVMQDPPSICSVTHFLHFGNFKYWNAFVSSGWQVTWAKMWVQVPDYWTQFSLIHVPSTGFHNVKINQSFKCKVWRALPL